MGIRLVRYLAQCGVASRRGAADLVREGLVTVNGEATTNVSLSVEPTDTVTFRGEPVAPPSESRVLLLYKPAGQVCSRRDPHNPHTVLDNLPPDLASHLLPVGRLDKATTGLLLLTDDGDLAFRLTHPRYELDKTYRATVEGFPPEAALRALREGVTLEDGVTSPARVRTIPQRGSDNTTVLEITIHEGRNRQVRRMCEAVGHRVLRLERIAYGPLTLRGLKGGEWRPLSGEELRALRHAVELETDSVAP
jgi:pseudouridine synthase